MADRYWVGGTGTWNTTSTTNWSTTSGGAAGASAPGAGDTAVFNAASGGGTITLGETVTVLAFLFSNFTGTFAFGSFRLKISGGNLGFAIFAENGTYSLSGDALIEMTYSGSAGTRSMSNSAVTEAQAFSFLVSAGSDIVLMSTRTKDLDFTGFSGTANLGQFTRTIYGSLTLSANMNLSTGTNEVTFGGTSGPYTVTTAGKTLPFDLSFFGTGGTWNLSDDLTMTRTLRLGRGTLNAGTKNVTTGAFALYAGTKTLTLGSGTWTITGASWNTETNKGNLTVSPSTATISMTSASPKTFSGGGFTWPILNQGGAGALTVQQSNIFTNITNTVQPATITLTSATTQTVTNFGLSGTAGNLITINSSTPGSRATLSKSSGAVTANYVSIQDNIASGGAFWEAVNSTDAGNNLNWFFSGASDTVAEISMSLRSFTERRIF